MSLASLEINTPSLQHTKVGMSSPASWLFLEKAFLGMSAWHSLVPNVVMSKFHSRAMNKPLIGNTVLLDQDCEWPFHRCPGSLHWCTGAIHEFSLHLILDIDRAERIKGWWGQRRGMSLARQILHTLPLDSGKFGCHPTDRTYILPTLLFWHVTRLTLEPRYSPQYLRPRFLCVCGLECASVKTGFKKRFSFWSFNKRVDLSSLQDHGDCHNNNYVTGGLCSVLRTLLSQKTWLSVFKTVGVVADI